MAVNKTDISVAANGDIRWTGGGSTYYTVLELRRFLGDIADDAVSTDDDYVDITSFTPADRSTDRIITLSDHTANGGPQYNIDDVLSQHLYDGSITQKGGDELYAGLVVVGSLAGTTTLLAIQNNTYYDDVSPYWSTGINTDAAANILLRTLIKVKTGGSEIDGQKVRIVAREWGHTYAEFSVTMGLGNSTAAIFTNLDINNEKNISLVGGYSDITNTEGYQLIDLQNGNGNRPYYSQWDLGSRTINDTYERAKWTTIRGATGTIHSMTGDLFRGITTEWGYTGEGGGPFTEDEILTWGTGSTAGSGALLALLDEGVNGTHWIQLLTGVVPATGAVIVGGSSNATGTVHTGPTTRSVSPVFIGQSTGNSIIGAFGIGYDPDDLTNLDKLTDLNGVLQQPPNNVVFSVTSVISGEDRVLVGPATGAPSYNLLYYAQLSVSGAHATGAGTLHVQETIPSDTPKINGTVRAYNGSRYDRLVYSSFSGKVFTLTGGGLPASLSTGANSFISYIDRVATGVTAGNSTSETFTVVYSTDRNIFIRVRDGGSTPIKTFESPGTVVSSNSSVPVQRISDA